MLYRGIDSKPSCRPIQMSYLRKALRSIPYGGLNEIEQYISQFQSIEIQIGDDEMKRADKLEASILPFNKSLQRRIKSEHPKRMEIAYDAALGLVYMLKLRIYLQFKERPGNSVLENHYSKLQPPKKTKDPTVQTLAPMRI